MNGRGIYTGPGSSRARDFVIGKKGSRSDFNLLSLAGGTYKLETDDEWQELYRLLALDYEANRPNFLVQRKTDVFPLAFDIDFKHAEHQLDWLIDNILPAVCRGLLAAMVTESHKVSFMLSTAPSVPCELSKDSSGYKSGAHLHFLYAKSKETGKLLDVIANEDSAMAIREACITELKQQHGEGMDWATIVDPSVLQDNGELLTGCLNTAPLHRVCLLIVALLRPVTVCRSKDALSVQGVPLCAMQEAHAQP